MMKSAKVSGRWHLSRYIKDKNDATIGRARRGALLAEETGETKK